MTEYTYIPQKDSERFWTIKDVQDGRGFGAYCSKDINKGELIGDSHYTIDNLAIAITEIGKFHNHSDNPTCKAVYINNRYTILSINNMKTGEEITVNYNDYSSTLNIEKINKSWKKGE
tara:strand:- start:59 stop:412 length:354 start_codon:yes stop_codon:yes gene_type:complete